MSDCAAEFMAAGDMNAEAMMMTDLAGIYYRRWLTRAEKMWRQAVHEFRQIGNRKASLLH